MNSNELIDANYMLYALNHLRQPLLVGQREAAQRVQQRRARRQPFLGNEGSRRRIVVFRCRARPCGDLRRRNLPLFQGLSSTEVRIAIADAVVDDAGGGFSIIRLVCGAGGQSDGERLARGTARVPAAATTAAAASAPATPPTARSVVFRPAAGSTAA